MKFAKELEQELVPEWRIKYLDYKAGKKQVKSVARAVNRASGTPRMPGFGRRGSNWNTPVYQPHNNSRLSQTYTRDGEAEPADAFPQPQAPLGADSRPESEEDSSGDQKAKITTPMLMPGRRGSKQDLNNALKYGSFVPTPPASSRPQHLELPGPALPPDIDKSSTAYNGDPTGPPSKSRNDSLDPLRRSSTLSASGSAYEVGPTNSAHRSTHPSRGSHPMPRQMSTPSGSMHAPRNFMHRLISHSRQDKTNTSDVVLPSFDQVRARQKDFFKWMDGELDKIEKFYKEKEDEAGERLKILREQLHEMRDRRIDEIAETRKAKKVRREDEQALDPFKASNANGKDHMRSNDQLHAWIGPVEKAFENAKARARGPREGSNSKALQNMFASPNLRPQDSPHRQQVESGRDYVRRPHVDHEVPYRAAKRKLKIALKEYYRGLELLKSYALLNRTAFRKINKKYDKAVNARPPLRYMSEKVNKAWFVQSTVVEGYIKTIEDLYARYFERGNHKVAIGKLRCTSKTGQHTSSAFRSGIFIGTGAVFAIQGLVYAADLLIYNPDATIRTETNYLLQIYAGYFLALYLFAWFCVDCIIWSRNKINYVFIFEFDPRNHLDWRELAEFPSFLFFTLGLFMWLNFSRYGSPEMFIYYPVILIFIAVLVIFLPAPILFHRSRRWFVYSHWRLLLAGLYPVEFRDFLLGDMYCSLTFLMSNIELFFCLYAHHWVNPAQCNSSNSRLLGFFSTLPGIWRALQCIRRYWDTRAIFPHLLNCGKYSMTIMYYLTLSLYRMDNHNHLLALFITFASINAIYTSIWDLAMDWSLCQPHAKKRFLRDVRGYKSTWPYYLAMTIDPILRFNWIFYVIYTHDLQHSSIAAFFIAFSEVSRRGMWTLFRVENEHCANVAHFKASRDVPLPYPLSPSESDLYFHPQSESPEPESTTTQVSPQLSRHRSRIAAGEAAAEDGVVPSGASSTMRRRGPLRNFTKIFSEAHTQDFEKKRRPGAGDSDNVKNILRDGGRDSDGNEGSSDDEGDDEDVMNALADDRISKGQGKANGNIEGGE